MVVNGGTAPCVTCARVARILIVGGGCRGRQLARGLASEGHAVRITTRSESRRREIEAAGAQCWVGTPQRLGTLRGALDGVTFACWLLAQAAATSEEVRSLYGSRLERFVGQLIDTTVRGFVYDASPGAVAAEVLQQGAEAVSSVAAFNAIPVRILSVPQAPGEQDERWLAAARQALTELLGGPA
jgi:NAD(P)-dependent dehydrogenase (short-subunit alcohol dehydrogenase family)